MKPVSLSLNLGADQTLEIVVANFDFTELSLLARFVKFVERCKESAIVQRGMPTLSNIIWSPEQGMRFVCPPYQNSELYELLHVLRPLILQNESTSFQNVLALLGKKITNDKFRTCLKELRMMFDHGELKGYMQISLNGHLLFDDATLKTWLNSTQYHTDEDKVVDWQKFEEALSVENTRALVITQLHSKVKALFMLQHLATLILK